MIPLSPVEGEAEARQNPSVDSDKTPVKHVEAWRKDVASL